MKRKTKITIATAVIAALAAIPLVGAAGSGDNEAPITGDALEKASAAALAHVDDPTAEVTDTEVGDEESYYEVEVSLGDGRQIDVQLDEGFNVVGEEVDGPGEDDQD